MSHLTRIWMAASVAVVQGHPEGGLKSSTLRSLQSAGDRVASASAAAAAAAGLGIGRALREAGAEDRRNYQADDSLRKAMYLSCWGPC